MGGSTPLPVDATTTVPAWLCDGNPAQFLRDAKLHAVELARGSGQWRIRTTERYTRSQPSLVLVDALTTPQQIRRRLAQLAAEQPVPGRFQVDFTQRWNHATQATDDDSQLDQNARFDAVTELLSLSQGRTHLAPPDALVDTVVEIQDVLTSRIGPTTGVYVVRPTRALLHRAQFPLVLLRQAHDPQLRTGNAGAALRQANAQGQLIFNSSRHLFRGIFLLDPYLGPLLAALSPAVWAFSAPRGLGTIVYTLGRPVRGTRGEPAEPLHMLFPSGGWHSLPLPMPSDNAGHAAISWWTSQLNELFGVLTDLAVFTDTTGQYHPTKHLQGLLTAEQLFCRVHSILVAHRDSDARRTLLFAALDALTALTGRDLVYHCKLDSARKTIQQLRDLMQSEAAEVLLPTAERAATALEQLQSGFFLGRHASGNQVTLFYEDGTTSQLGADQATAHYLGVLRNGTHGFTARKGNIQQINALLVHHDGDIPQDLALLAYLYLLDVLAHPDILRGALYRRGRTNT
ncbi:MAG: hypothetical protein ACRDRL_15055 [Sciscionella sp.]